MLSSKEYLGAKEPECGSVLLDTNGRWAIVHN
jgi:hypothetical protein